MVGPGRRASYEISIEGAGLVFKLDGEDADGRPVKVSYGGPLDGAEQRLPPGSPVGAITLSWLNERTIVSCALKDGRVVDRWTRELLADGDTMLIIQHGVKADGESFQNRSMHKRRDPK